MNNQIVKIENIEEKIITIRNEKVIIDSDVADIYGVETKRINEAVKNNPEKFPFGYILELDNDEWKSLRSKFSTIENSGRGKHKKYNPKAFTEKGLYMLATILKSPKATETTISIIETFAKIRELGRTMQALTKVQDDDKKKNYMQKSGEIISDIFADDLDLSESETSIELNFALLKFKHTIKKK
jgi:hypothetical protein